MPRLLDPPRACRCGEGFERAAVVGVQQIEGAGVAVAAGRGGLAEPGVAGFNILHGSIEPVLDEKLPQPLRHTFCLELVRQHGGHGQGDVAGDVEHRQVGVNHRIEQPLLTEGVGAVALDIGHVRVQDDPEIARAVRHGRWR